MTDPDQACLFCNIIAGEAPAEVVFADDSCVVFLDARPVFPGHCLVVPKRHVETLPDLDIPELEPYFGVVQHVSTELPGALDAHGSLVCINNTVSQSVPHLHTHVIPRRFKDGLRGFLWPRHKYADAAEAAAIASKLRSALATDPTSP